MNVKRINSGFTEKYPYQYYIDLREVSPWKCAEILKWAQTTPPGFEGAEFQGTVAGLGLYFKTEQDITMFLLKWS